MQAESPASIPPKVADPYGKGRYGADTRAGLIVFLVALPLCLGIATASGAPPLAGMVAGIVGGTIVALASGSHLSVAGPAAGLTVIVLDGIEKLGLRAFLLATLLAGVMQVLLGAFGLGRVAQLVPNAVIRGMLAAIGLILVLKQLPHAIGYDKDYEGDTAFFQPDGHNTFSELLYSIQAFAPGAVVISVLSALALLLWRDYDKLPLRRFVPRELMAVVVGLGTALALRDTGLALSPEHRVSIPLLSEVGGLSGLWVMPDFSAITQPVVWTTALTVAIVASIESLLSLEATDRLDPYRRVSSPNRELIAQGLGNTASGALGGLPVTAVVVRSFTNVQSGGRTRVASVVHGVFLLLATLFLASVLNQIPLAALAIVLIAVGYKLTAPSLYKQVWAMGREQFVPFIVTIACILFTDLLTGTLLGIAFSIFFIVYTHYRTAIVVTDDGPSRMVRFVYDVSFLHKARLKEAFEGTPRGGHLIIDGTRARSVDADVVETIQDFQANAPSRGVTVSIKRSASASNHYFRDEVSAR
jgi:MFS superfamily sulfate permease-like transporter